MTNPFTIHKPKPIKLNNPKNPSVALVDLDRTICLNNRYYIPDDFSIVLSDEPNPYLLPIVKSLEVPIVIISCRPVEAQQYSAQWLLNHGILPKLILHRQMHDSREDWVIKEEMMLTHVLPHYFVGIAFDDKVCIRAMYEKYGIPTFKF